MDNQNLTDGELIRIAKVSAGHGKVEVPLHHIATAACLITPLKINPTDMGSFCKFLCPMAAGGRLFLVDKFLRFWSVYVDPQQVAMPHGQAHRIV